MRNKVITIAGLFLLLFLACHPDNSFIMVPLPGGDKGIGFDDLRYSQMLQKVMVPGGKTGSLFLIDPASHAVSSISGFHADASDNGKESKITSVDEGEGLLFVTDVILQKLYVVDPAAKKILEKAKLTGDSDFVRYVALTHEVWVTEGDDDRIEVFTFDKASRPMLRHAAYVSVPDGPEGLVIDSDRNTAYTNVWNKYTVAVDIKARKIVRRWDSGCEGPRGIEYDSQKQLLFIGCEEGKAISLDLTHGNKIINAVSSGSDVDIIGYDAKRGRVFLPGSHSGTMAVISVAANGELSLLEKMRTIKGAHCVTTDDAGNAYVCDPDHGRIMILPSVQAK